MNRILYKGFILLFCLITVVSYGQFKKNTEKQVQMDYAAFQAKEDWTYLEMYFTIPRDALKRTSEGNLFRAEYTTAVYLYAGDSLAMEKSWKDVDSVQSMEDIKKGQSLTNQTSFFIKEGHYKVKAVITDLNDQSKQTVERTVDIRQFSRSELDISDLELALQVRPDTVQTRFYKNGYTVIPNPPALYGLEIPVLNYYCEIYLITTLKGKLKCKMH